MRIPERRLALAAALLLAAVPWVFFWRGVTMEVLLGDGDTFVQFLPTWTWAAAQWKELTPPLWNPYLYSGFPLFADPTAAVFHPLQALFILFPPQVALNFVVLAYFGLAGVCTFLVARQEGLTVEASALGGVVFTFSGFLRGHEGITPLLMTAAAFPTLFWALGRARRRPGWGSGGLVALVVAHLVLCGHPQFTLYALVCGGAYAVRLASGATAAERRAFLSWAAVAVFLGVALTAVQILPTAELMGQSVRDRLDYPTFLDRSYPPPTLLVSLLSTRMLSLVPADGTEARLDVGALPLLLAGFGIALRFRRSLFWTGLLVLSSLLWLGDTTPLYPLMYHVPVYNLFRIASRNGLMLTFAVAMLAAYGTDALQRRQSGFPIWLRALFLATAPVAFALGWGELGSRVFKRLWAAVHGTGLTWSWQAVERYFLPLAPTLAAMVLAGVVLALCLRWGGGGRVVAALAIVLSMSHFWGYRSWLFAAPADQLRESLARGAVATVLRPSWNGREPYRIALGGASSWINFLRRDRTGWRATYVRAGGVDINMLHGVASIGGYSPMMIRDYARFAGDLQMWGGSNDPTLFRSAALDLLDVRYVVVPPGKLGFPAASFDGLEPVAPEEDGLSIYRNPTALGFVWGVEAVEAAADAGERVRTAARGDLDVRRRALVAPEDAGSLTGREFALPARLSSRYLDGNTVAVEVDSPGEAFLATSLLRYPGWRATVDGERVPLVRVNGLFQGFAVPAGRHRVLLRYLPGSFLWGLAITALTAAVLVFGTLVDFRRSRRLGGGGPLTPPPPAPAPTAG